MVGANGIGKTTALQILSGNIKPNLGKYEEPPEWKEIIKFFKGNDLYKFFNNFLDKSMKSIIKI